MAHTSATMAHTSSTMGSALKENKEDQQLQPLKVSSTSLSSEVVGIVGLRNTSLYCYLNAIMQCMAPIEGLRDHYV
jgi:ubiquitin C-terminal hydrolase